ncbi:hypothetical protein KM043_000730 [Ampulex compressa]|nr:hypothetical protein KM043_000730 [Ampulex compressa]
MRTGPNKSIKGRTASLGRRPSVDPEEEYPGSYLGLVWEISPSSWRRGPQKRRSITVFPKSPPPRHAYVPIQGRGRSLHRFFGSAAPKIRVESGGKGVLTRNVTQTAAERMMGQERRGEEAGQYEPEEPR